MPSAPANAVSAAHWLNLLHQQQTVVARPPVWSLSLQTWRQISQNATSGVLDSSQAARNGQHEHSQQRTKRSRSESCSSSRTGTADTWHRETSPSSTGKRLNANTVRSNSNSRRLCSKGVCWDCGGLQALITSSFATCQCQHPQHPICLLLFAYMLPGVSVRAVCVGACDHAAPNCCT